MEVMWGTGAGGGYGSWGRMDVFSDYFVIESFLIPHHPKHLQTVSRPKIKWSGKLMVPFWILKMRNYEMRLKILEVTSGLVRAMSWKLHFVSTKTWTSGLQASHPWACLCAVLILSTMPYESSGHVLLEFESRPWHLLAVCLLPSS